MQDFLLCVAFFSFFPLRILNKISFCQKNFGYRKPHTAVDFYLFNWAAVLEQKIDADANNSKV